MEKTLKTFLVAIGCLILISIIAIYTAETTQCKKEHHECNNEIENYEKIKEFQFTCLRGDTTEFYANITYRGNEADLVKAIHEFRIFLLDKSLGTYEEEIHNLFILKQAIESHNVIPVMIKADGVGHREDHEQLKKKI